MNEIGILLKQTRENSGVNLAEASADLKIKELILSNIEDGNIGCFKDIFILKEYIYDYAKYLGLDPDKTIDEFNEYLFEYTSKIPVKEIEKAVRDKQQLDATVEMKVVSPYTVPAKKHKKVSYIIIYTAVVLLVLLIVFWAIKQITINNEVANTISYVK